MRAIVARRRATCRRHGAPSSRGFAAGRMRSEGSESHSKLRTSACDRQSTNCCCYCCCCCVAERALTLSVTSPSSSRVLCFDAGTTHIGSTLTLLTSWHALYTQWRRDVVLLRQPRLPIWQRPRAQRRAKRTTVWSRSTTKPGSGCAMACSGASAVARAVAGCIGKLAIFTQS